MADTSSLVNATPLTVSVPDAVLHGLKQLSEQTGRDLSELVSDALEQYVAHQEWQIAAIVESLAEIDAGATLVPNETVMAWIDSWDTPDELPPPA